VAPSAAAFTEPEAGIDELHPSPSDKTMLKMLSKITLPMTLQLGAATMALVAATSFSTMAVTLHQRTFATPSAAVNALITANRGNHIGELLSILGPESAKLIHSGDPVADKGARARFVASYDAAHKFEFDGDSKAILIVGTDEWPLPIPIIRHHGRWRFDTRAGEEEILNRRIGRNELTVIAVCRAYVVAQREYATKKLGLGGTAEYAQHFMSKVGERDGLYWPVKEGEEESPLGPLIAQARAAGYRPGTPHLKPRPYYGYYFRILTRQGPNASGGAKDYVVNDRMTGGFALIAYPATYGDSGIMTFIVNQNGIVYEKNFGPDTTRIAAAIMHYDPDGTWQASHDGNIDR
jgi:hypothetical protein